MVTVILIYLLIGWIVGFAITIYYSFDHIRTKWDDEIIPLILLCIYWPWFLAIITYHFLKLIINKLKNRSK